MKIFSWGANSHGQLGLGFSSEQCLVPEEVITITGFFDHDDIDVITGGGGHSLILTKDQMVFGCGWNASGQLGCDHYNNLNKFSWNLLLEPYKYKPKAIACGWDWSAAITDWGELMTWGSNAYGQLGFPKSTRERLPHPGFIKPLPPLMQVACGLRHMAAVTEWGRVLVWGSSQRKALGTNDWFGKPAKCIEFPTEVPGLNNIAQVACGQHHTVALTNSGRVYAWGDNKHGQLGLDPQRHPSVSNPTELQLPGFSLISGESQLVSGWTHSAIVTDDGSVITWGRDCYGQLGSHKHDRPKPWQPQLVDGIEEVKKLYLGSEHNIALLGDGRLVSWGWNEHGNCGTGAGMQNVWEPQPVGSDMLKNVVFAGTGYGHSFAVTL